MSSNQIMQQVGLTGVQVGVICKQAGVYVQDFQERNRQIFRRVQKGEARKDIALDLGLSVDRVRQICRQAGLGRKHFDNQKRTERNQQIIERVQTGETLKNVAANFGLTLGTVRKICNEATNRHG